MHLKCSWIILWTRKLGNNHCIMSNNNIFCNRLLWNLWWTLHLTALVLIWSVLSAHCFVRENLHIAGAMGKIPLWGDKFRYSSTIVIYTFGGLFCWHLGHTWLWTVHFKHACPHSVLIIILHIMDYVNYWQHTSHTNFQTEALSHKKLCIHLVREEKEERGRQRERERQRAREKVRDEEGDGQRERSSRKIGNLPVVQDLGPAGLSFKI